MFLYDMKAHFVMIIVWTLVSPDIFPWHGCQKAVFLPLGSDKHFAPFLRIQIFSPLDKFFCFFFQTTQKAKEEYILVPFFF